MKMTLRCRGLKADASLQTLVESEMQIFREFSSINAAEVFLERRDTIAAGFQVHTLLRGRRAAIHAAAQANTPKAAIRKVVSSLTRQLTKGPVRTAAIRRAARPKFPRVAARWPEPPGVRHLFSHPGHE